ncbi:phytoene desaturase family protein [Nocardia sp. NPDC060249]|uniref:phytoene desaturase family protein n=1 Tax=Nocardia sp. NPDC060249 TaxID=3347082 RepID=UPI003657208F
MTATTQYDTIVIGAGLGGMTTAAYLAATGQRVLVLERYKIVGGSSHVFRRRGRWEFEVGVHYIEDCAPGGIMPTVLAGLGIDDRVEFLPLDSDGFDTMIGPDFEMRTPVGWEAYRDNMIAAFPGEQRAVDRYFKLAQAVAPAGDRMHPDFGRSKRLASAGLAAPVAMAPFAAVLLGCGFSPRAVFALSAQAGSYCSSPDLAPFGWHVAYGAGAIGGGGAWFPRGGGQTLSSNLLQYLETYGGEVRTNATVDKILVEGGRAVGVRLRDGEQIRSRAVVSDADIKHTYLDLVGREHLPARVNARAKALTMGWPLLNTYFGIELDLRGTTNSNYYVIPSWEPAKNIGSLLRFTPSMLRNAHRRPREECLDDFTANMPAFLHSATVRDPHNPRTAPPGSAAVEVMTMVPPSPELWGVDSTDPDNHDYRQSPVYRHMKERVVDAMLDRVEQVYPGARAKTVWSEAATPATQTRYARNTDGAAFGLAVTPTQYGPTRPGSRTAIDGLFLAGTSTRWGTGTTGAMLSGVHAAGAVLDRDLVGEITAGAVFGDARALAPFDPDWDALAHARPNSDRTPHVDTDDDVDPITPRR